jgi:diguanylate cyclase (GGDEF)-like protein
LQPANPHNEQERLEALRNLDILDTLPEQEYDDLTRLAASLLRVPIAAISLIDEDRQWFKSRIGLEDSETPRSISFCGHAILGTETFVVPDASLDERFRDSPLVTGNPHVRFYAGVPLTTEDGCAIGALCVKDNQPRQLSKEEESILRVLARQVVAHFQLRRQLKELQQLNEERLRVERRLRVSQNKLRLANQKLKTLASIDSLTGLNNRRSFDMRLRREWKLAIRQSAPLSLLMVDLDHFKQVNDTRGHAEGDDVLKHIAVLLSDSVRETDFVSRFGGEEFAILLPGTSHQSAMKVAEHVRMAISGKPCNDLRMTTSIGVATMVGRRPDPASGRAPDLDPSPLVAQADAALYAAKRGGRNRVASAEAEAARVLGAIAPTLAGSTP